mmetsp:Transcript_47428/g.118469  ORF Transcript_47428/g.118469 Transcript_47428/m.118469 type:complete len:263 (+) Transcript_47428:1087-1875(+)
MVGALRPSGRLGGLWGSGAKDMCEVDVLADGEGEEAAGGGSRLPDGPGWFCCCCSCLVRRLNIDTPEIAPKRCFMALSSTECRYLDRPPPAAVARTSLTVTPSTLLARFTLGKQYSLTWKVRWCVPSFLGPRLKVHRRVLLSPSSMAFRNLPKLDTPVATSCPARLPPATHRHTHRGTSHVKGLTTSRKAARQSDKTAVMADDTRPLVAARPWPCVSDVDDGQVERDGVSGRSLPIGDGWGVLLVLLVVVVEAPVELSILSA